MTPLSTNPIYNAVVRDNQTRRALRQMHASDAQVLALSAMRDAIAATEGPGAADDLEGRIFADLQREELRRLEGLIDEFAADAEENREALIALGYQP